jgi:hypothetical protein
MLLCIIDVIVNEAEMLTQTFFKDYLNETLGIQVQPIPWINRKALPFLLRDRYEFFTTALLKTRCLLMVPKNKGEETPAVVRKHWEMAKEKWEDEVIYVPPTLSSFNRKRLIEQKVPFVVPGNQLYLPDMGMDLREHFKKAALPLETFSPATQVIVLDALVNGFKEAVKGNQLAKRFDYSLMTITRALNEIETTGLGVVQVQGRERKLNYDISKKELWGKAQPYLQNPAKQYVMAYDKNVKGIKKIEAGLTALARYSKLAEPKERHYAFSSRQFKVIEKNSELLESNNDPDAQLAWLEVWSYDPQRFAKLGLVDPFSLYLSLRDKKDERIEQALEEMMENVKW